MIELDELTLRRAQRGDRQALAAFVRHHQRPVVALVGRMLAGRTQLTDDVAQDVFVKLTTALGRFDPRGEARLSTWVLTIATRTCIDCIRRVEREGRRRVPLDGLEERRPAQPMEVAAHQRELGRRVEEAMAALPADQRAVLVLRAYHDLDYDEIAAAADLPKGTIKSRLSRARAALKRAIGVEVELDEA